MRRHWAWIGALGLMVATAASVSAHEDHVIELESLNERLSERPDDPDLLLRRGQVYLEQQQFPEAVVDFDHALAVAPAQQVPLIYRGLTHHRMDASRRGLEDLDRYIGSGPPADEAYEIRAEIREALGDMRGAVEDLTEAIALNPIPEQFVRRARLLEQIGDLEAAKASFREGIERLGASVPLVLGIIELERASGGFDEALGWIERLEAMAERPEQWMLRRAEVLAEADRAGEAHAVYEEVLDRLEARITSGRVTQFVLLQKVQALAGLERRVEARSLLLSLDPATHALQAYQQLEEALVKSP